MPKGRILAVDDQRYFRELIEVLLTEEGYEVQTASSGEEALRVLDHAVFDVILTDLVMPIMNGTDLVQRVKERDPDQDIVVITGVVDVRSAVDAMKVGATDYLLKPFDRTTLATALDSILQRGRLRIERDRLLAENIEYLGERSLFERALGLFSCLSVESLSQKLLEGLCNETGAQGGVLWLGSEDDPGQLSLFGARGLVRVEEERSSLSRSDLPKAVRDAGATTLLHDWIDEDGLPRPSLLVAVRRGARLIGLIRLTDKLGGEEFDEVDRACAEKFVQLAEIAHGNAERFQGLEQRSLQDPGTGAYRFEYLEDVVRNEIEKANRFGRTFGLLKIAIDPIEALRRQVDEGAFNRWQSGLTKLLTRLLRATDLLAIDDDGAFWVLLAEADAIGAATFKQRTRRALEESEPLAAVARSLRPSVHVGFATYPGDATQLESLTRVLEARLEQDRRSIARDRALDDMDPAACLRHLLDGGATEPAETVASLVRFALTEIGRRPRDRNLFFFHPGDSFVEALRHLDTRASASVSHGPEDEYSADAFRLIQRP